jgi:hypothetical protein
MVQNHGIRLRHPQVPAHAAVATSLLPEGCAPGSQPGFCVFPRRCQYTPARASQSPSYRLQSTLIVPK